jgi:type I site-specific restriction endonuclease
MHKPPLLTSNFAHLQEHDAQLLRLGMLAERYFPNGPNTSLLKLRQLAELLAQLVATKVGLYQSPEESQYDLLRRRQDQGILPRELTRKQLRELALELDKAGFSEASLATAWREMTNQDITARIVGYIRQAAIGDPLVPYDQRVDSALQKLLASRPWSTPQRQWLQKIAAQTKANMLVDREALDDPDLVFRREGGGFARLDRIFGGELQQVLDTFNESLWATA